MPILSFFSKVFFWEKCVYLQGKGAPIGAPRFLPLAAAAAIVIAAAAAVVAAPQSAVAAAVAEQDDQQDDPVQVAATEIIIAHNKYLQDFFTAEPLIPCYSAGQKMCGCGN